MAGQELDIDQFAQLIGRSKHTVRRLGRSGEIVIRERKVILGSGVTKKYLRKRGLLNAEAPPAVSSADRPGPEWIRERLSEYIKEQSFPLLESFAVKFDIEIDHLYGSEFDDLITKLRTKTIAALYDLFLHEDSRRRLNKAEFRYMLEHEEKRPVSRNPQRMYEMMINGSWIGRAPNKEELFSIVEFEENLLGSSGARGLSTDRPPEDKSSEGQKKKLESEIRVPLLRLSKAQFALYADLTFQAVSVAVQTGKLADENGILVLGNPTREYLAGLSSKATAERTRAQVKLLDLEHQKKELELREQKKELIRHDLVRYLYFGFMNRLGEEMLSVGMKMKHRIDTEINSGVTLGKPVSEIAAGIAGLITSEIEEKIRIVKRLQKEAVKEWEQGQKG